MFKTALQEHHKTSV